MASAMDVDLPTGAGVEESKGEGSGRMQEKNQKGKGDGDRNVMLHPLTVITISDHYTRVSTGGGTQGAGERIIGLLFGVQDGLDVSIYDAMEVACEGIGSGGIVQLNNELIEKQKELYTAVYPTYEILGWYSVGTEATKEDLTIQRQMMKYNQAPLFLLMNPHPAQGSKELPVLIHESEVHMLDDQPTMIFVTLGFQQLETSQAEQISVEHVAKATPNDGISAIDLHGAAVGASLKTLLARINVLKRFGEETRNGKIPPDYRLLRQLSSICNQLPTMDDDRFLEEFMREYNDSLTVTYLATVQKSTNALNELADKFVMAFGDRHRRTV
ncbi:unnamed protein product [Discosporangium mesarthrocarpum]